MMTTDDSVLAAKLPVLLGSRCTTATRHGDRVSTGTADEGFVEFVRERSTALLRTATLLCSGDRGAAEDLVQEVLARVYCRWHRITGPPENYVRAALVNAAGHRWRRRSRRVTEAPLDEAALRERVAVESGYEERLTNRDVAMRALATLPPRMRAVIVLRFFEDCSEEQAAAVLGCGVGTVKSQTSRGLAKLRGQIDLSGEATTETVKGP